MTLAPFRFKFFDRGFKKTLVLIPGWATDYRIFSGLELNYNYLLPIRFDCFGFKEQLLAQLNKRALEKVSLFGWSLGGFLACGFACAYPERVDELFLLSVQKKYTPEELKNVESRLKKNKRAYLYKFYLGCFSDKGRRSINWFRKNLLEEYLKEFKLGDLLAGLDYLSWARIGPQELGKIKKIITFHSREDQIAPFYKRLRLDSKLTRAKPVLLSGPAHALFLSQNFREVFSKNG